MKIFPMTNISGKKVTDNIPADTATKWSSSKAGGYDAWAIVQNGKNKYQSLSANNTAPTYITTMWKDIGLVNEWAYLDGVISTQSVSDSKITMTYELGDKDEMIALGGLCGSTCTVTVKDSSGNVVSTDTFTIASGGNIEMSWWHWTYPQELIGDNPQTDFVKQVTPAVGQTVTVEIEPLLGKACIGMLALGELLYMGCTLEGVKREIKGSLSIGLLRNNIRSVTERKGYVRLTLNVKMVKETTKWGDMAYVDEIQKTLEKYVNIPLGFFADDTGDSYSMRLYGVFDRIESSIRARGNYNIVINSLQDITQ